MKCDSAIMVILDDNGDTWSLEDWTAQCRQLGRCDCGQHKLPLCTRHIRIGGWSEEVAVSQCDACGAMFDSMGKILTPCTFSETVNPSSLSITHTIKENKHE